MDTTDPNIKFDEKGWCDYCRNFHENILPNWHPNERGAKEIEKILTKVREDGKHLDYDCLIGLSGGVDSSYLAYIAKEKFNLRPLIFHVDTGWNSHLAADNIEKIIDGLDLDLHTEVINWEEMKDIQLAFFKAQVPHIDTPQDHAIFASLYNFAEKHNIKYILTGANIATECVREPLEWHYHASDLTHLKDIHRRYGERPLTSFPTADIFTYKIRYKLLKGMTVIQPLNYLPFIKEEAKQELFDKFGWQKYANKHYESRFTRFYEGYWLPTKFGYDKRRAHFSSEILSGQMSRNEALHLVASNAYNAETIGSDFAYVATKLGITVEEFQNLMNGENKTVRDYKSDIRLIEFATKISRLLGVEKRIIR